MAKTYNRLEIDVNKKPNSIGIRPVQNDTKSRYLDVCLYENGVAINLTGEQVRITFRKADGSTFFNQGEVTDATAGRCQFALTNEILSEAKAVEAQISVWNAGGQILSTQVFEIYVTAAIPWTDAVESENEYGVLVVLFQEIQDALDTMHKIAATFGEPGDKAAEYGVDTFWGILEMLAQRGDAESATEKVMNEKIKAYLNSAAGTNNSSPLDVMINALWGGVAEYTTAGTYQFAVPKNVRSIKVTACGGGGAGAAAYNGSSGGGGGSGGAAIQRVFTVTPLSTISITVGSGGIGTNTAASSAAVAASGNATVVGTLVTLAGGKGGAVLGTGGASAGEGSGTGGTGVRYNSGSSSTAGSKGLFGKGGAAGGYAGGGGGSIGNGGKGGEDDNQNGTKGGGGGGAVKSGGTGATSSKAGNGGDGYVKIEWGLAAV